MRFQEIIHQFLASFGENFFWYAAFAFPFFIVFWWLGKQYFKKIRIQTVERANNHHFKHDLGFSVSSMLIFTVLDICFLFLESKGYTKIYFGLGDYGWGWLIASFFVALVVDDTFFYWSHRLMHAPRLYRFFHKVHHESTDPSPLTAYAFHPSEAVVEAMAHFILPFLLPINFGVMIAWQIYSMLNNVIGHLGYEIYPKYWVNTPILQFKTTSTHHNMHHQLFNGNYALYFTWWDKWMGTEFKDYKTRHQQIFEREETTTTTTDTGAVNVKATVFGTTYTFNANADQTLLESALAQGIPLPYSCQKGRCGMCKMKCTAGKVHLKSHRALTDAEVEEGYVLTCQSQPQTPEIALRN